MGSSLKIDTRVFQYQCTKFHVFMTKRTILMEFGVNALHTLHSFQNWASVPSLYISLEIPSARTTCMNQLNSKRRIPGDIRGIGTFGRPKIRLHKSRPSVLRDPHLYV